MIPFLGKKEEKTEEQKSAEMETDVDSNVGKYNEACGVCGKQPTDKHWAGQYFHKKCFRKMKKMAKGMI